MRRNAALFVVISLLSGFGSTAMMLAASIWTLDLTGSVGLAALTPICIYLPTLASPWLGTLVDRVSRRPLLIWTDVVLGVLLLSLLAVHSVDGLWLIFAVLLARGVGYVLLDAGESAILPAALPPSLLGDVNGWRSSAQEGMKLVAPLAGAGLYAWRGPIPVVVLCAVMPLLTAVCYALVRLRPLAPAGDGPVTRSAATFPHEVGAENRAGVATAVKQEKGVRPAVRLLLRERDVRVPVLVAAVAITLSGITGAALLSRIVDGLHMSAAHLGILASAQGAGSILGGLAVGRLLARTTPATAAGVGAAVFAAGCGAWCLPWWPGLVGGSVIAGVGLPWTLIAAVTAVQTRTPDPLLGRVAATSNMVMFGPIALAIPVGSALVQFGTARPPLLAAAAIALLAGVLALSR